MSESDDTSLTESDEVSPSVKSIRHRNILDVAAANPDASLERIAAEVPTATAALVEQVLEEHGDPAADSSHDGTDRTEETDGADETDTDSEVAIDELSARERRMLHAVYMNPEATQAEIGEIVGLSRSMVSKQLNSIDGFEWADRYEFVSEHFDDISVGSDAGESNSSLGTSAPDIPGILKSLLRKLT